MFELCVSAINVQIGAAIVKVILTRSSPSKKKTMFTVLVSFTVSSSNRISWGILKNNDLKELWCYFVIENFLNR